jgi:2-keto-4-pentenoate hydratase/2-oxohepta-3-ene-1,7-dioic acid hydratase in catechol pathway
MKFATLKNGTPDGQLVLVSRDGRSVAAVPDLAVSLLDAVQRWDAVAPALQQRYDALNAGQLPAIAAFDATACAAPLPRSPQWLDASAFLNHGHLMEQAFNTPPIPDFDTIPVMYQGASDDFLGPTDDVPLPSEDDGIDFEGEFGVVVGEVPMSATAEQALACVRLTAGSILGSGTVSNVSRAAGSACIAERRVIEKIDLGEIRTGFMRFGDRVRMQARFDDGREGPFGVIDQRVVQPS